MQAGTVVRKLRLASGLILMAFVASHLTNLLIGIHSLAAMEAWRATLMGPWKIGVGFADGRQTVLMQSSTDQPQAKDTAPAA
jgi:hypothetical protein